MKKEMIKAAKEEMQRYIYAGNWTYNRKPAIITHTKFIKGVVLFIIETAEEMCYSEFWLFMYNNGRIKPITTVGRSTEIIVRKMRNTELDENEMLVIALRGSGAGITGMGTSEFWYDTNGEKLCGMSTNALLPDSELFK